MSADREPAAVETLRAIMTAWARGDLDAVLACLRPDVLYYYHVGSPPLVGRDAVGDFLRRFGAGQSRIAWRITHWALSGERLFVEGVDDYVDVKGRRIEAAYMGVFEFENGLVKGWRDYLDLAIPAAARRGEPAPEHLRALYDKPSVIRIEA